jgi:K+-transporting ATPase KdpF subunit
MNIVDSALLIVCGLVLVYLLYALLKAEKF